MVEIALIAACIALALLPPKLDSAILIKERQMGITPSDKFWKGMRNAILPSLVLWAAIAFIVWIVFFRT